MHGLTTSVSEALRKFADAKQQFLSVNDGWIAFLAYLQDRRGADVRSIRRMEEIQAAIEFVADGNRESPSGNMDDPRVGWFNDFERRQDILEAFSKFAAHRGLSMS